MSSASAHEISANCCEPLGPIAAQRLHQPVGMVDALGVARDLLADHAGGVVVAHASRAPGRCACASSRSTSSAQVLVQSCGQTEGTMVTPDLVFLARALRRIGMIVGDIPGRSARSAAAYRASAHGNTPHPPRHDAPMRRCRRPGRSCAGDYPRIRDRAVFVIDGDGGRSPPSSWCRCRSHQSVEHLVAG